MKLIQGRDYYIENGKYVFTEYFLLDRGWCCGNGCRHCPYGNKIEPSSEVVYKVTEEKK